jgi:hypothetical protein
MNPKYAHIGAADDKLIEEMAELTKELCKVKRFGMSNDNRERIILEIGDVEYRLKEYKELLGIP